MTVNALAVWAAGCRAGLLDRTLDQRQYIFAYDQAAESPDAQVSLTMPVRLESWLSRDIHPIFQMNLPEGALLEVIRRAIAKLVGEDDLTILRVTGGNQIGRNRFSCCPTRTRRSCFTTWCRGTRSDQGCRACSRRSCWMRRSEELPLLAVIS